MDPLELVVEIRDITLTRIAQINLREINPLAATLRYNNVGSWSVSLPARSAAAELLRAPGAGIIVSHLGETLFSGPTSAPSRQRTAAADTWTITGVTDDVILADALAWPDPTNGDITTQAAAADARTGPAETVLRGYVDANIGPSAPMSRRGALAQLLTVETDLGRGATVSDTERFGKLGELLARVATAGGVGFRVLQVGGGLVFRVFVPVDRSGLIRLDMDNGTTDELDYGYEPPALTRALVGGDGDGESRAIIERSNTDSVAAEAEWGRRIEEWVDERSGDTTQMQTAGDDRLAAAGATKTSLTTKPVDTALMQFGRDYFLGDKVAVVVDDLEIPDVVSEVSITVDPGGLVSRATIGDPDAAVRDPWLRQLTALRRDVRRLSRLERT
jgi:hypothetical protein